jgi:hypothetical protein
MMMTTMSDVTQKKPDSPTRRGTDPAFLTKNPKEDLA